MVRGVRGWSIAAKLFALQLAVIVVLAVIAVALVWAAGIGYVVWGDVPGVNVWLGVAIVIASGLYIVRREASLGLPRGGARSLQPKR